MPTGGAKRWVLIPRGVLTALGLLIAVEAGETLALLEHLWPVALIGAGLVLLWRTILGRDPR